MNDDNLSISPLPLELATWETSLGWQPQSQWPQFQRLYESIVAGNQRLNLTRITEPLDFVEKHLWDSLAGLFLLPAIAQLPQTQVIDIGTGAGFPGIPTAIAFPDWSITLLDSTRKKIQFIDELLTTLQITNAKTWLGRAETLSSDRHHRSYYDLALIRAVAQPAICAQYALPLVKLDGWVVLYRGQWEEAETEALLPIVEELGGEIETIKTIQTPWTSGIRNLIYLRKVKSTAVTLPRLKRKTI
ncbi:MAG: 16S rRNA (guanine(527)-N(7))-methyltransferase RsmG [Snowella sp.]|nr:16S rRNA (guanine(527)-N(7))-methyltransferase RsmG [Snowella sp.]